MRPNWKSLADFPFTGSPEAADLSYLVLFIFSAFGCPPLLSFFPNSWNLLLLDWKFSSSYFYLLFFSSLVPCVTAPLFMNVCSIFSNSSLHDWVLETQLFFSTVAILFRLCCASQGSPGSGILWDPNPISPIGLLFGLLTLADWAFLFLYGILKISPFMGLWIPILWTCFILLFFLFFFLHYRIAQCVIFHWALGCG